MERIEPLDFSKVLIARRWSKFEYDMHESGMTGSQQIESYRKRGIEERMLSAHLRQIQTIRKLSGYFKNPKIVVGETLIKDDVKGIQAVVALGGDGHFAYVSHFLKDQLIIGINADTVKSIGALTYFDIDRFEECIDNLKMGQFNIENWTRLQITLNDQVIDPLATQNIYIGAKISTDMSRYFIEYQGIKEEQKTSGIVVSTGTGSTGWHEKISLAQNHEIDRFPRTANYAKFFIREGGLAAQDADESTREFIDYHTLAGTINRGEQLILQSSTDQGVISPDSYRKLLFDFSNGDKAVIELAEQSLRVVKPLSES